MEDTSPPPHKDRARLGRLLAPATAAVLAIPLALVTVRHWITFLRFETEETRPMMEIGGGRAPLPPRPPATAAADSLSFVRGEAAPAAATTDPAPPRTFPLAMPPSAAPSASAKPRYPKLRKKEWRRTGVRSLLDDGKKTDSSQVFYYNTAPVEDEAPSPSLTAPGSAPAAEPATNAAPRKPRRQPRPKPAPPAPAAPAANTFPEGDQDGSLPLAAPKPPHASAPPVEPGHKTSIVLDDKAPEPAPQAPKYPVDPCPAPGWWKNGYTGLCYKSKASCEAADNRRGAGTCKL